MAIKKILDHYPDGRFVVVHGRNEITTMECKVPRDLSAFDTPEKLFLAGYAHARLNNLQSPRSRVMNVKSEEL